MSRPDGGGVYDSADAAESMHAEDPPSPQQQHADMARSTGAPKPQGRVAHENQPGEPDTPGQGGTSAGPSTERQAELDRRELKREQLAMEGRNPLDPFGEAAGHIADTGNVQEIPYQMIHALGSAWNILIRDHAAPYAQDMLMPGTRFAPDPGSAEAIDKYLKQKAMLKGGAAAQAEAKQIQAAQQAKQLGQTVAKGGVEVGANWNPYTFALGTVGDIPTGGLGEAGKMAGELTQVPQTVEAIQKGDLGQAALHGSFAALNAWILKHGGRSALEAQKSGALDFLMDPENEAAVGRAADSVNAAERRSSFDPGEINSFRTEGNFSMVQHAVDHFDSGARDEPVIRAPAGKGPVEPAVTEVPPVYQPRPIHDPANPEASAAAQAEHDIVTLDYFNDWRKENGLAGREFTPEEMTSVVDAGRQEWTDTIGGHQLAEEKDRVTELNVMYKKLGLDEYGSPRIKSAVELQDALHEYGSELNSGQLEYLQKNWAKVEAPYDLVSMHAEEPVLQSPMEIASRMSGREADLGRKLMGALHGNLGHIHSGPYGAAQELMISLFRKMVAGDRTTLWGSQRFVAAYDALAKHSGADLTKVRRAIEGGPREDLTDAELMLTESYRLLTHSLKKEGKYLGPENPIGDRANYLARVDADRPKLKPGEDMFGEVVGGITGRPGRGGLTSFKHKARTEMLTTGEDGRLQVKQRFDTIDEIAALRKEQRGNFDTWLQENRPQFTDKQRARVVDHYIPMPETDMLRILNKTLGRDISSLHSRQAMRILAETTREWNGEEVPLAVKRQDPGPMAEADLPEGRALSGFRQAPQGYHSLSHAFPEWVVHPEFAALVNKAMEITAANKKWHGASLRSLLDVERVAVSGIMYSPMIHGLNVLGRAATLTSMNPIDTAATLFNWAKLSRDQREAMWWNARMEFYEHGGMPANRHNKGGEFSSLHGAITGDEGVMGMGDYRDTAGMSPNLLRKGLQGVVHVGASPARGYQHFNNFFWNRVNDFGVLAYMIEKRGAQGKLPELDARLHAADRANSWMGAVRPENWSHQSMQDISRALLFAPNWGRTWVELMSGHTIMPRRLRTPDSAAMRKYRWGQEIKTIVGAYAFQKVSGNLLNYLLSGHFQDKSVNDAYNAVARQLGLGQLQNTENLPGTQDMIEITRAAQWLHDQGKTLQQTGIFGLSQLGEGLASIQSHDPKTGGRLYLENPLARFQLEGERILGLQSGQKDFQPQDITQGIGQVMVNRLSPLVNAGLALGLNLDLHRSIYYGKWAHVDPNNPLGPSASNALIAAAELIPGFSLMAYPFTKQVESELQKGQDPVGPWGTHIPKTILDALGGKYLGAEQALLTGLTGLLPPRMISQRSRGESPSDQQYKDLTQYKEQHTEFKAMQAKGLFDGSVTFPQWMRNHHDEDIKYRAQIGTVFDHAPQATDGVLGLLSKYENIFDEHKSEDGTPDWGAIEKAQAKFRFDHADQWDAVQTELRKNDHADPATHLYHNVINEHLSFQNRFARSIGTSGDRLREEIHNYYAGAPAKQTPKWLQEYSKQVDKWETSSWAGFLYGLYYDTASVRRVLKAKPQLMREAAGQAESLSAQDEPPAEGQ